MLQRLHGCLLFTAQSNTCGTSGLSYIWWKSIGVWYVSYDSTPCGGGSSYHPFCNESGWGDEEATVVCREQGFSYGLGSKYWYPTYRVLYFIVAFFCPGYVLVQPLPAAYRHIECDGSENRLADCDIGPVSFQECRYVGVVTQCSHGMKVASHTHCN